MTLRARSSTGPASGANRVELGKKASTVLTTTVDATVEKELAKQATTAPDIPRQRVFEDLHTSEHSGHRGQNITTRAIQVRFYWLQMRSDILKRCA